MRKHFLTLAVMSLLPGLVAAADFGTITIEGKITPLISATAYSPHFDVNSDGKPDVVVILATQNLGSQTVEWIDPSRGAAAAVAKSKGIVLTLEYSQQKIAHISVDGPGLGIEHQGCAKCQGNVARSGNNLKDHVTGEADPIGGSSSGITFDTHFDIAKVQTQNFGEPLPADGGDPGKAFLAYAKAYADGDFAALKKVSTEAEELFGDEDDAAKRTHKIITFPRGAPRNPVILKSWQNHDSAVLIVEGNPVNFPNTKFRFSIGLGLGKTNGQWQVREQKFDVTGKIFAD